MKVGTIIPIGPLMLICACGGDDTSNSTGSIPPASSVVASTTSTPTPTPTPAPTPTPIQTTSAIGILTEGSLDSVPSGLNVDTLISSKSIPPSATPDVVGAFRFLCGPGQLSYDDPIVYPGETGKSHLHQWFGNLEGDAHSTYESLRQSGGSTCTSDLNRSSYWMPALLDGRGNAIRPNHIATYYKRRPKNDAWFVETGNIPTILPRGLRYIFGWDMNRNGEAQEENRKHFEWKCVDVWTPIAVGTMSEALARCGAGKKLAVTITSSDCWDGVNLDSPNHRSHMANMIRGPETNYVAQCPDTHPNVVAKFTMTAEWSIESTDDTRLWSLSSDHMLAEHEERGSSMHADWLGAWEDEIMERWHSNCIDKLLNCSDGDLGDGSIMKRNAHYPSAPASPRLVIIPETPSHIHTAAN